MKEERKFQTDKASAFSLIRSTWSKPESSNFANSPHPADPEGSSSPVRRRGARRGAMTLRGGTSVPVTPNSGFGRRWCLPGGQVRSPLPRSWGCLRRRKDGGTGTGAGSSFLLPVLAETRAALSQTAGRSAQRCCDRLGARSPFGCRPRGNVP